VRVGKRLKREKGQTEGSATFIDVESGGASPIKRSSPKIEK
jgi:hypothetical protein